MKFNSIAEKVNPGQGTVESSLHGLATIVAIMAALFCSGQIWAFVFPPMFEYLENSYGHELLGKIGAGIFALLSIASVFFICRIFYVIGLMVLAQNVLFRFAF